MVEAPTTLTRKPVILFLVRSLERGGAERQLVTLASGLARSGWVVSVACFYSGGPLQRELDYAGISVFDLGKCGRWDLLGFFSRLARVIKAQRPDVVHGYLPGANLAALLLRLVYPRMKTAWGMRASSTESVSYGWLTHLSLWLECRLAGLVDLIIVNSEAGMQYRVARGCPRRNMRVIPNGIDVERFRFDAAGRRRLRDEWQISEGAILVGLVARLDPVKDHATFLEAAAILALSSNRWRFVCVGSGPAEYALSLHAKARALGLAQRLIWVTARDDMAAVYSALDIAACSSIGEGFPNVVGEAMACGRPCAVTDVGDSAEIVGELGVVIPSRDPSALASALERLQARLEMEGGCLRAAAQRRIRTHFGVAALIQRTASALAELTSPQRSEARLQ